MIATSIVQLYANVSFVQTIFYTSGLNGLKIVAIGGIEALLHNHFGKNGNRKTIPNMLMD
ncbi:MAG: hypothetical protein CMA97_00420 [Euryarchaeota archaeon]|nr:hypothetical protein [Euryarchaeota archaeon]|tara:strand:+ start:898 stop:1077 length:180 start_codon:yes stop_codon:yes gene_type:complete